MQVVAALATDKKYYAVMFDKDRVDHDMSDTSRSTDEKDGKHLQATGEPVQLAS